MHLAEIAAVRHLVPPGMKIVAVLPGRTLASLYFASYKGESSLTYHELAIAVAVVSHDGKPHAWAPQLYVDEPASVAGGRAIWGLHKTLATFERTRTYARGTVTVRVDGRPIAALQVGAFGPALPLRAPLPAIGLRDDAVLAFAAAASARVRLGGATVDLPDDSPFRPAFARGPLFALRFDELALDVPAPA